jgi:hypothetical protein
MRLHPLACQGSSASEWWPFNWSNLRDWRPAVRGPRKFVGAPQCRFTPALLPAPLPREDGFWVLQGCSPGQCAHAQGHTTQGPRRAQLMAPRAGTLRGHGPPKMQALAKCRPWGPAVQGPSAGSHKVPTPERGRAFTEGGALRWCPPQGAVPEAGSKGTVPAGGAGRGAGPTVQPAAGAQPVLGHLQHQGHGAGVPKVRGAGARGEGAGSRGGGGGGGERGRPGARG